MIFSKQGISRDNDQILNDVLKNQLNIMLCDNGVSFYEYDMKIVGKAFFLICIQTFVVAKLLYNQKIPIVDIR